MKGTLGYYTSIEGNLETGSSFQLVSSAYLGINVQAYSSFFVRDIDDDGLLNMFVGQDLGGLFHFEVNPESNASVEQPNQIMDLVVYPNPTSDVVYIRSGLNGEIQLQLMSPIGQQVHFEKFEKETSIQLSDLPDGIYFVIITDNTGKSITKRIVKA
jgi:hypothetical protein